MGEQPPRDILRFWAVPSQPESTGEVSLKEALIEHVWNFFPIAERHDPFSRCLNKVERLEDGRVIYAHIGGRGRNRTMVQARRWVIGCIDFDGRHHEVEMKFPDVATETDETAAEGALDKESTAVIVEAFSDFNSQQRVNQAK